VCRLAVWQLPASYHGRPRERRLQRTLGLAARRQSLLLLLRNHLA
jgi:hypothetical protein